MHPDVAASYQRDSLASVSAGVAEAAGMVDGHMARAVVQMVKVAAGYMETAVVQTGDSSGVEFDVWQNGLE